MAIAARTTYHSIECHGVGLHHVRLCPVLLRTLLHHVASFQGVTVGVEQYTIGRQAITASTPGLLMVSAEPATVKGSVSCFVSIQSVTLGAEQYTSGWQDITPSLPGFLMVPERSAVTHILCGVSKIM